MRCRTDRAWDRESALVGVGLARHDAPVFRRLLRLRAWYIMRGGAG